METNGQTQITDPKIDALTDLMTALTAEIVSPLDRVQILRMIADTAKSAQREAVPAAHRTGSTWDQIGKALGTSRQSAHALYSD